ncbi:MAG TPA: molybdopterin molybdotransferase MoeA [Archaeoglobaceae archaeon]|nr:molybdopterin molybdotransferase MoeA [Archaeoglobaceae archaeon]
MDVRSKGFSKHVTVDEALKKFFSRIELKKPEKELIFLTEAVNRILAEDIISEFNIPHFDRAAVDGYAVRAEDTFGASFDNPLLLKIVDKVEIGEKRHVKIGKWEAVRIATGGKMPEGSNAVVMIEYTKRINGSVEIYRSVTPNENVSVLGEDVKAGEIILKKGTVLKPQDVGMFAASGRKMVEVLKKPVVSVFSTGDELVDAGENLEEGNIVDTNRYAILSALKMLGCDVIDLGISKDIGEEIKSRIEKGLRNSDMVIVSGGTSVGEKDLLPEIISELGEIVVHGVATKPGMPAGLAKVENKPVVMLPGFPVAALVAFYNFVPPILEKMLDACIWERRYVKAIASRRIPSKEGVRTFTRVVLRKTEKGYLADPVRTSGSGILSSMVKSHGFAIIPEESEGIEEGDEIEVLLLREVLNDP